MNNTLTMILRNLRTEIARIETEANNLRVHNTELQNRLTTVLSMRKETPHDPNS